MNKNEKVDAFLTMKAHPMTPYINEIREIILDVSPKVTEDIKWNSPTFIYKGNIASFFMNAKKFVSLMFHKGAFLDDPTGLLQGEGKEGRVAHFENSEDILAKKSALQDIIRSWINLQDE
ncbi:MAG: DUF1801 domain-containing protein [Cytophagales bacterium]|nr:DUF1801 domain-containing protein [Cytophagales bacterium]